MTGSVGALTDLGDDVVAEGPDRAARSGSPTAMQLCRVMPLPTTLLGIEDALGVDLAP